MHVLANGHPRLMGWGISLNNSSIWYNRDTNSAHYRERDYDRQQALNHRCAPGRATRGCLIQRVEMYYYPTEILA